MWRVESHLQLLNKYKRLTLVAKTHNASVQLYQPVCIER